MSSNTPHGAPYVTQTYPQQYDQQMNRPQQQQQQQQSQPQSQQQYQQQRIPQQQQQQYQRPPNTQPQQPQQQPSYASTYGQQPQQFQQSSQQFTQQPQFQRTTPTSGVSSQTQSSSQQQPQPQQQPQQQQPLQQLQQQSRSGSALQQQRSAPNSAGYTGPTGVQQQQQQPLQSLQVQRQQQQQPQPQTQQSLQQQQGTNRPRTSGTTFQASMAPVSPTTAFTYSKPGLPQQLPQVDKPQQQPQQQQFQQPQQPQQGAGYPAQKPTPLQPVQYPGSSTNASSISGTPAQATTGIPTSISQQSIQQQQQQQIPAPINAQRPPSGATGTSRINRRPQVQGQATAYQPQQSQQPQSQYGSGQTNGYATQPAYGQPQILQQQDQQQGKEQGYGTENQAYQQGFQPTQPQVSNLINQPHYVQPPATPPFQSPVVQQMSPSNVYGVGTSTLTQGMQQMSLGTSSGIEGIPAFDLSAGPVSVAELDNPPQPPTLPYTASALKVPTAFPDPRYKRITVNCLPASSSLANKLKLPLGLLITPCRKLMDEDMPIPVINPPQIVRCRRCRTYINPWVELIEQGNRWQCNLCSLNNEIPAFMDWNAATRQPVDRLTRAELTHSVVDYVASKEYMMRPPQPVVFVFVIDVSYSAIQSGMVATAARTILNTLDSMPNTDMRTKVAFVTFDSSLHFYNLSPGLTEPQMLVVSGSDELFLPLPFDLLVSLSESRAVIESLLKKFGDMFKNTTNTHSILGRALQAAHQMINKIGGKIIVLQSTMPNEGDGALKPRDDVNLLGTAQESQLLQPQNSFYKQMAIECAPSQIAIDLFLFNSIYIDIATLSGCVKFTGGTVYHYDKFNAVRREDVLKFTTEFSHFLSKPIGLEAVLRVRASRGVRLTAFHGSFFLRSSDLLVLPNVTPDNSYGIEFTIAENITTPIVSFQTAVLHTSSEGQRRIRVITTAVPVTNDVARILKSIDQVGVMALQVKKAVERSLTTKLEDAREQALYRLEELIQAYRSNCLTTQQGVRMLVPYNLRHLPLLTVALLKSLAFRSSKSIPSDFRSYILSMMYIFPPEMIMAYLIPRMYLILEMPEDAGTLAPVTLSSGEVKNVVVMPPIVNPSSEKLTTSGIVLVENGLEILIWVGKNVPQPIIQDIFGVSGYEALPAGKVTLPYTEMELNRKVNAIVGNIRKLRITMMNIFPTVYVVKEDGDRGMLSWFQTFMVEDKLDTTPSYPQFIGMLRQRVMK